MIDPREIIERFTAEDICEGAERYFASIVDTGFHERKPLSSPEDASELLLEVGFLLRGLQLGPGMRVLDLGAGTGWLSRYLNELGCRVTACDPSATALDIGRRANARFPFVDLRRLEYEVFDGRNIDHPAETFDRIVCFEALHHIPNWEEVLGEVFRVLKTGGVVGFAEPGFLHSRSPMSQYEMANHVVLENDVRLDAIVPVAERLGFQFSGWETVIKARQDLASWRTAVNSSWWSPRRLLLGWRLARELKRSLKGRTVFFLAKGPVELDSRRREGLAGLIETEPDRVDLGAGENTVLNLKVTNIGDADWLWSDGGGVGQVYVGVHDCTGKDGTIHRDIARVPLGRRLAPGEVETVSITLPLLAPGSHMLTVDLVAEGVAWFESAGDDRHRTRSVRVEVH
ncbi:MAG: methyltransferase domain-containing protein [Opitutaceae bacterium]